jgi:hypothetical protein
MAGFGMAASPALAKTVKECQAEWQANKNVFLPKGISVNDYIVECRDYPAPAPETPAAAKPAPAAEAPAPVKPPHVAVAVPVAPAPSHASTEAHATKAKKPEVASRSASRAEFNSKPELDRSAHKSNPQLVASPPPAPMSAPVSCVSLHSNTTIHSERCGF